MHDFLIRFLAFVCVFIDAIGFSSIVKKNCFKTKIFKKNFKFLESIFSEKKMFEKKISNFFFKCVDETKMILLQFSAYQKIIIIKDADTSLDF